MNSIELLYSAVVSSGPSVLRIGYWFTGFEDSACAEISLTVHVEYIHREPINPVKEQANAAKISMLSMLTDEI